MFRLKILVISCWTICSVKAIPIDNGVEGEPEIECGASTITASFNTRNSFEGHVYVKGRFAEQGCRNDENGRKVAAITLPFTACGVERTRSLNPRGIFVSITVVITFHPQFLTKVDRAYTLQCFYMEADKTVSQALEVSEITTLFQSQQVPMPVCRYDILDGSPTGQPIKFAVIGQQVYHKWACTTDTTDIFCMVVHDCFVDDGAGNKVNLLNENGCALDRFLLQNLEYSSDLMAGREAHVFKYADKAALFFQCQITITIKEPGAQCPRPQCPEPGGIGGGAVVGGTAGPGRNPLPTRSITAGNGGSARPVTRPNGSGQTRVTNPLIKVTGPPGQPSASPQGQPSQQPQSQTPQPSPPPGLSSQPQGQPTPTSLPGIVPQTPAPGPNPTAGVSNLPGIVPQTPASGPAVTAGIGVEAPTAGIGVEAPARRTKAPPTEEPPPATGIPAGHPIPDQTAASSLNFNGTPPPLVVAGNPNPAQTATPALGGTAGPNQREQSTGPTGPAVPGQNPPNNPQPTSSGPVVIVLGGTAPPQVPYQGGSVPPQYGSAPPQIGSLPPPVGTSPSQPGSVPPQVGSVPPQVGSAPPQIGSAPPQVGSVPPAQPYATNAVPTTGPTVSAQPAATGSLPASAQPNAYGTTGPNIPSATPPRPQPTGGLPAPTSSQIGYAGDLPIPLDFELLRKKRDPIFADEVGTWDLRAQPIVTFDIDDDSAFIHDLHATNKLLPTEKSVLDTSDDSQSLCMTSASLGLFLSFVVASVLTAVVFSFLFCMRRSGHI